MRLACLTRKPNDWNKFFIIEKKALFSKTSVLSVNKILKKKLSKLA